MAILIFGVLEDPAHDAMSERIILDKKIEYLGYITRDGIKPQSNKVQAILANCPKMSNNSFNSIGMVQYCCDLGPDRAKCLPLSPHWLESAVR
jgi:hypothetical protein